MRLVSVVGFLSYAFRGIAEFHKPFFPWDIPAEAYGTVMLLWSRACTAWWAECIAS